jgi:N-acetylmuramoyl-L-alanine amidase
VKLQSLVLLLAVCAEPLWASQIVQLRVAPAPEKVRMVFDLDMRPDYSFQTNPETNTLTLHFNGIDGASFTVPPLGRANRFLQNVRQIPAANRQYQIQLQLGNGVKPRIFTLAPQKQYRYNRLVVDLVPGALSAQGSVPAIKSDSAPVRTVNRSAVPATIQSSRTQAQPVRPEPNTVTIKEETVSRTTGTDEVPQSVTRNKTQRTPASSSSSSLQDIPPSERVDRAAAGRVIRMSDLVSKDELSAPDTSTTMDDSADASAPKKALLTSMKGKPFIVAIDAGHGGKDPGATGPDGIHEKNVTLPIARRLAALINQQPGMKAVLTRKGDYFVELTERSEIARRNKARLLISIHADSGHDSSTRGASIWVLSANRANREMKNYLHRQDELLGGAGKVMSQSSASNSYLAQTILDLSWDNSRSEGYDIGKRILRTMSSVTALSKKRPVYASLAVLKSPDIPSLLIETGFISNPTEEHLLNSANYQQSLANAIFNGITSYYGSSINAPSSGSGGGSFVKSSDSGQSQAQSRRHVVKPGESLRGLAAQYGVSPSDLRNRNKLKSDNLLIGQVIVIPTT